jgi:molybdopterin synthase catalytic subunit
MSVRILEHALDPWALVTTHQDQHLGAGSFGATAVFVGTMRDFNEGQDVAVMRLDHYPDMTEAHLNKIEADARTRWPLLDVFIAHRVGEIEPGDPIVVVCAWSAHRAAAFDACRFIMEDLKSRAPFWKKESLSDGAERWVEKNTPG